MTAHKVAPICRVLGISRACAYRESVGRPSRYARAEDRVVLSTAAAVLAQIPVWLADYNAVAPHSALGFQARQQYSRTMLAAGPMR